MPTATERRRALQQRLNLALPLIQAPMAGVQGSALAIAVSEAGALGSLPAAMLSTEALGQELQRLYEGLSGGTSDGARGKSARPWNVNFFCHVPSPFDEAREVRWRQALAPHYAALGLSESDIAAAPVRAPFSAALADVLERFAPPVVSFHFGLPEPALLARVKALGAFVMSSATTVEEALWLQAHGADAVIAQGLEAGGHRGMFLTEDLSTQMGTMALLPQVLRAVDVPVIAAGGIADADGVRAALALGASAVQAGTAFLLCPEATTSAVHRAALQGPGAGHTALTNLFSGRPARSVVNRVMRELGPISPLAPAFPMAGGALQPLRARAESQGLGDYSPLWSGQNASGCRAVPAAEVVRALAAGVDALGVGG